MKTRTLSFVVAMMLGISSFAQKSESFKTLCEAYQTAYTNYLPGYLFKLDTAKVKKTVVDSAKHVKVLNQAQADAEFDKAIKTAIKVACQSDFALVVEFVSKTANNPKAFILKVKGSGSFFKEEQKIYATNFQKILKNYNADPNTFSIDLYIDLLFDRFKKKRDASLKTLMGGSGGK